MRIHRVSLHALDRTELGIVENIKVSSRLLDYDVITSPLFPLFFPLLPIPFNSNFLPFNISIHPSPTFSLHILHCCFHFLALSFFPSFSFPTSSCQLPPSPDDKRAIKNLTLRFLASLFLPPSPSPPSTSASFVEPRGVFDDRELRPCFSTVPAVPSRSSFLSHPPSLLLFSSSLTACRRMGRRSHRPPCVVFVGRPGSR